MFDALSERLNTALTKLKRQGKLTEKDLDEGLREVRRALLEADVNYKVTKRFVERVREKAVGQNVMESLTPGQQIIKIVRDELTELMGQQAHDLDLSARPTVWMIVGLQGSGKTTTAGKLANHYRDQGRQPLLAATDVHRPAAIDQLQQLGSQLDLPVHGEGETAPEIAQDAVEDAKRRTRDMVLVDTAGRLQIDEALMDELAEVKARIEPSEILLVADAMTGQEAVSIAETFHERLGLTGIVLTKMDGDARGGAALSMVEVTGVPIVFLGTGEKSDDLEVFHPDRLAQRVLGMGDVLGLIEDVEKRVDQEQAEDLAKKLESDKFTLEDFQQQLSQVRDLGPLDKLMEKMPGMSEAQANLDVDEDELNKVEAIINSMTPWERRHPESLNGSRKKRIAAGAGTRVRDINSLLKRFKEARKMMKQMKKMGGSGRGGGLPF